MTGSQMGERVADAVKGSTGRTWVRRPAERRTDLLDAAERLLAERGLGATTVADITSAAGVSKGSFYVYFASRDELVEALNARFGDELFLVLDDVLTALVDEAAGSMLDGSPIAIGRDRLAELLGLAVDRMVRTLAARRDLIEVWSREPAVVGSANAWLTRVVERLAPWVGHEDAGGLTIADPTTTALLVVHGIFGTVLQAILLHEDIDVDALVVSARAFAVRAFGLQ
jgi:AcrR family transcriptional regulator